MKKVWIILTVVLSTVCISAEAKEKQAFNSEKPVKNIVLLIGDGMGTAQLYAGMTANGGKLHIERLPWSGFSKTYSTSYITDSGAGGTAIATGTKTYNGAIGVDPSGKPVKSILEWAEENGKATGLVATCAITHATPASFIAHQAGRNDYEKIAEDFLKTPVDVFIGGGLDHFSKRKDSTDLTKQLVNNGYNMAYTIDEVRNIASGPVAGLLYPVHPPKWSDGRGDLLAESAKEALRLLSQDKDGFFLMIEGSQIDWACHSNDGNNMVEEMNDFDRAVGAVMDFAEKNGETLVIVTADHETGGVTLKGGDFKTGEVNISFSSTDHTGVLVPVFSFGPYAEKFSGIQENTDLFIKMMDSFGFGENK